MEIGDEPPGIGFDGDQPRPDPIQQRQSERDAGEPVQQITNRHPFRRRIAASGAFEKRVECGPEIGAEYQGEGGMRRHHALSRQRHGQEHRRHARMRCPGHRCRDDYSDDRLRRNRAHQ